MVAKVKEVDADALGMSGLLVKSTLIMRENLEELNSLGLTRDPGAARRGGADPHATSSATCARSTRGACSTAATRSRACRTLDKLMEHEAQRRRGTRTSGGCRRGGSCPRAPNADGAAVELPAAARRTSRPTTRCSSRRSSAPAWSRAVARRHRRVRQRDRAVPQPVAVPPGEGPRQAGERRRVQVPHPARRFREQLGRGQGVGRARAAGRLRLLPGQRRRRRPRHLDRRDRAPAEAARFHYPRQQVAPFLCIADFFRPGATVRGEVDYAAFHIVTMGAAVSEADGRAVRRQRVPAVPAAARPRRRDGRGARRVLAPPHPRRVGLRRRGRPDASAGCSASSTAAAATRGATRRARTWRTTPPSPGCSAPSASASRSARRRAGSTSPSRPPRRSSATTPRPSTSSPADRPDRPAARRDTVVIPNC